MRKILFPLLSLCVAASANAAVLNCDDERDHTYEVKMDTTNGRIEIFKLGSQIGFEAGTFENCSSVGPERGAVIDQQDCDFISSGDRGNLGTLTIREDNSGYYNMNLADRNFRGSCH